MDTIEVKRLIRRCENMEYGRAKLEAALETMALADENGDPWCRIASRYFVSWSYVLADDGAKSLPFCAEFFQLLEQYPHIKLDAVFELSLANESVHVALSLPQIPREQCQALLDYFASRSKFYNSGKYHYQKAVFEFQMEMGMYEQAECSFERFRTEQPDEDWSCEGCDAGQIAAALIDLGHREQAIEAAQPLLTGAIKCNHSIQPQSILACLLQSDLEHGCMEEAAVRVAKLTRIGFRDRSDLFALSQCLLYQAVAEPERALSLLEKGIAWSVGMLDVAVLFYFYRSAWALCDVLAKDHAQLTLGLPKKFPLFRDNGLYQTHDLAKWFYENAAEIGQKFDRRNGTDKYAHLLLIARRILCEKQNK